MPWFKAQVAGKELLVEFHKDPHFDEILAGWLVEHFGTNEFLDEYAPDGKLHIGVGGGPFDEHPGPNNQKKDGECAATLVAKALGVDNDPALEPLLHYAWVRDLRGGAHPFELETLVKVFHRQFPNRPLKVIRWVEMAIEAKYQEQLQFVTETKTEFERAAEVEEIAGPGGRTLKMVSVVSDNPLMNKFARSAQGGYVAIIIQQQTSGNVQIFTDKRFGIDLRDVVRMIRLEEQKANGELITTDWRELEVEGKIEGIEEWYYHREGQMLLNGSLTAPNVPPTRLSLKQIKEIVGIGVNSQAFEPSRALWCQAGECSATREDPCSWYRLGLLRCRRIRYEMRNRRNSG